MNIEKSGTKFSSLRTEHHSTLHELARYKLLVENIEDYAIFMMDTKGYIQTWNKGARKNKGYKAEEIIGKHFSQFYSEEDNKAKKPERELELAIKFGRVEDEDWRIRKDGSKFWANVVITTLYDENGTHVGFAKVTRNLTERKHQEDELRNANLVLRKQQAELRALNNSKDEFVSLASHQLRTPATGIKQLLGMLLENFYGPLSNEHRVIIEKAYRGNERQLAIVNSLLKVAQIDAGKVNLVNKPFDIAELIDSMVTPLKPTFAERDQIFDVDTSGLVAAEFIGDKDYLRMALENIIDNASKYTQHGGTVWLNVSTANSILTISVKDSGIGIASKDMSKLFQRFSRISNKMSDEVDGTGLGLYWANKVIELHDGRIKVDSKLNEGTTFTVTLPIGTIPNA